MPLAQLPLESRVARARASHVLVHPSERQGLELERMRRCQDRRRRMRYRPVYPFMVLMAVVLCKLLGKSRLRRLVI